MKLDPEFKKKWLEALRSGKFKQGSRRLYDKTSGGYCCLGVALTICGLGKDFMEGRHFVCDDDTFPHVKPKDVPNFPEALIYTDSYSLAYGLSSMNDNGDSFEEIADYIEKHL